MVIDSIISAAFKNSVGGYELKRLFIFQISSISKYFSSVSSVCINNKKIEVKLECPICGEYHYYIYTINELIEGSMVIGGCEKIGSPVFFIGKTDKVEEKINKYIEVNKKIHAML